MSTEANPPPTPESRPPAAPVNGPAGTPANDLKAPEAVKGLPPVAPPSGRFIAQLFLVPGLIVAVAVLLLLLFKNLIGGTRTKEEYLQDLDSSNAEVRWRAAHDLAQILKRRESLVEWASDPALGLELARRLDLALKEL